MSAMVDHVAEALAQSFKDRVAASAGTPFEQTGVVLPSSDVWQAYAEAAVKILPETLVHDLVVRAAELVRLLDDAEVNHGGLWSGKTMKARDELRLELSWWTK